MERGNRALQGVAQYPLLCLTKGIEGVNRFLRRLDVELNVAARAVAARCALRLRGGFGAIASRLRKFAASLTALTAEGGGPAGATDFGANPLISKSASSVKIEHGIGDPTCRGKNLHAVIDSRAAKTAKTVKANWKAAFKERKELWEREAAAKKAARKRDRSS